jgi:hypothetical protein
MANLIVHPDTPNRGFGVFFVILTLAFAIAEAEHAARKKNPPQK